LLVAVFGVHIGKGFFVDKGGYEYALALLAASVSLLFTGGGRLAADAMLAPSEAAAP
jgi:putative oxidoreductase